MKLKGHGLFPKTRMYIAALLLAVLFTVAFFIPALLIPLKISLAIFISVCVIDLLRLYGLGATPLASRQTAAVLSLGSKNSIQITLVNRSNLAFSGILIDELPEQLQLRDFSLPFQLKAGETQKLEYQIRPLLRGEYHFGDILLFIESWLGLFTRRVRLPSGRMVPVYPSVIEMKQFELKTFASLSTNQGIRKLRRIGHSYEFEQIRNYVQGDEYRSINWKSTGRRAELMVNQFTDEKSQQIYSVIDVSRVMQLPFKGLSLLDYAINTSLVISNIALRKQDKAGLIHFNAKTIRIIPAERTYTQLRRLLDALYNLREDNLETNLELLYTALRKKVTQRSLVFLYTNFESLPALERALPLLKRINLHHLLVVVVFENEEISRLAATDPANLEEIYIQTAARRYVTTKMQLVNTLRQQGIQAIYTVPENLSTSTVNKYLELKSRGMV